jgi:hypothetical protein
MEGVRKSEVVADEQYESCANCGYDNGFHVALVREEAGDGGTNVRVILKCPSCSTKFDVGWVGTTR